MSQLTEIMSAVIAHDGVATAYGCAENRVEVRRFDAGHQSDTSLRLNTGDSSIGEDTPIAVVVSPPTDANPGGAEHIFVSHHSDHHVAYLADPGGTGSQNVSLQLANFGFRGTFGAAALADGVVLCGFDPTSGNETKLRWSYLTWQQLEGRQFSAATYVHLDCNALTGGRSSDDHGAVRLVVVRDAKGVQRGIIAAQWKGSSDFHLMAHQVVVATDGSPSGLTSAGLDFDLDGGSSTYVKGLQLQQSPAGPVYMTGQYGSHILGKQANVGDGLGAWSDFNPFGVFPSLPSDRTGNRFQCLYLPGPVTTSTSTANSDLQDSRLSLYPMTWWTNSDGFDGASSSHSCGQLRRRGLARQPENKTRLLGIIAGPPPVPVENLNMPIHYDNFSPNVSPAVGSTSYAHTVSSSGALEMTWGVGVGGSITGRAEEKEEISLCGVQFGEEDAYAQLQVDLQTRYQGTYKSVSSTTTVSTVSCDLRMAGTAPTSDQPGDYNVDETGTLVVAAITWTGYTYEFVDTQGQVPDGGLSFTTLFPAAVDHDVLTFSLNPEVYAQPGDLMSYLVTEDERNTLIHNAVPLSSDTPYLSSAWAVGSTLSSEAVAYAETEWSNGFNIDLSSTFTSGEGAHLFGVGESSEFTLNGSLSYGATWRQTRTDSVGIASQLSVRGNMEAPGTYTHYQWATYQLRADKRWSDQLRGSLVTGNFPAAGTNARTINQEILNALDPDSAPWLITYALGNYSRNPG